MNTQTTNSDRPSWADLHPALPPRVSPPEAKLHWLTKQTIAAMPRSILGVAILGALGRLQPMLPRQAPQHRPTEQALIESGERIRQMQTELAAKGLIALGPRQLPREPVIQELPSKVEELRDSVTRSEAQTTFEAAMRVKGLRGTLEA